MNNAFIVKDQDGQQWRLCGEADWSTEMEARQAAYRLAKAWRGTAFFVFERIYQDYATTLPAIPVFPLHTANTEQDA